MQTWRENVNALRFHVKRDERRQKKNYAIPIDAQAWNNNLESIVELRIWFQSIFRFDQINRHSVLMSLKPKHTPLYTRLCARAIRVSFNFSWIKKNIQHFFILYFTEPSSTLSLSGIKNPLKYHGVFFYRTVFCCLRRIFCLRVSVWMVV